MSLSIAINSIKCFEKRDTKEKVRLNCGDKAARRNVATHTHYTTVYVNEYQGAQNECVEIFSSRSSLSEMWPIRLIFILILDSGAQLFMKSQVIIILC